MPSPFPGMDPYIESTSWQNFHNQFVPALGQCLVPQVSPLYVVDVAQDIYLVRDDLRVEKRQPDVAILRDTDVRQPPGGASSALAVMPTVNPVECTIPLSHERAHRFVEVRASRSNKLVTVVEVLSPTNKIDRRGRRQYLAKRQDLIESGINLVEIDLVRRGRHLPIHPGMPAGDYFAVVCRAADAPRAEVYAWKLRDPLPGIPIPLGRKDGDVTLPLQSTFTDVYNRAGFGGRLPYDKDLVPPVGDQDRAWLTEMLAPARARRPA